jgi:hypothetical protein
MAGCKGTLMIDPESTLDHYYVKVRESMVKFPSNDWTLDICDYSRPSKFDIRDEKSGPDGTGIVTKFFFSPGPGPVPKTTGPAHI